MTSSYKEPWILLAEREMSKAELRKRPVAAKLPVLDIHERKDKIQGFTGKPRPWTKGDRVVAEVIGRDSDLLGRIYNVC